MTNDRLYDIDIICMEVKLHKGARTTLKIKEEIRNSSLSIYALSKRHNLSCLPVGRQGILKKNWKDRDDIYDKS